MLTRIAKWCKMTMVSAWSDAFCAEVVRFGRHFFLLGEQTALFQRPKIWWIGVWKINDKSLDSSNRESSCNLMVKPSWQQIKIESLNMFCLHSADIFKLSNMLKWGFSAICQWKYFSKSFKTFTNMTPSEYKRSIY